MKLALVTRADKNIEYYSQYTHPILQDYAKFLNADFIIFDHDPPQLSEDGYPHFRILKIGELLNSYDRVVSVDSDVVINKGCPNIFDEVPEDSIGSVFEDYGPGVEERREKFKLIQQKFGYVGWKEHYINTGVLVVSKMHKDIFTSINGQYWGGECSDDVHIGYNIHKYNFKVFELSYKWNHMRQFTGIFNASLLDSYIIHFSGGQGLKLNSILNTIKEIYG